MTLQWVAASDAGRVRTVNEDAYVVFQLPAPGGGHVFAVADGMGGHQAGDVASRSALQVLAGGLQAWHSRLQQPPTVTEAVAALTATFKQANLQLMEQAAANPRQSGMGTTMTALYLRRSYFAWAHVGDSRLYLYRAQGSLLEQLTADDGLVAELVRSGRLPPEKARTHPQRHVLTQALGLAPEPKVQTGHGRLEQGHLLLVCTDGLTSTVTDAELANWLKDRPHDVDGLIALVNQRGGPDNVTVIVVDADQSGLPT